MQTTAKIVTLGQYKLSAIAMTAFTLNLTPELTQRLQTEAAKQGVEPDRFILHTLQERLKPVSDNDEAALLQTINIGLPPETWEHYHNLIAKRQAETLTPEEHRQLINLSTQIETLNVQRIQALIQLATRRHQPLPDLMESLGINPNPEVVEYV
jgi:putative heme iron utilization protein